MPSQDYELPRDQTESQRLNSQHTIYRDNLGYILNPTIAASIPSNARIADIGTGTGAWMLELASERPNSTLEGLDISNAQFPKDHPSHCSFRLLNILEPLPEEVKGKYDVVHLRLLVCGLAGDDWKVVASHALEMLKPGGWVQWCESDFDNFDILQSESGASREALLKLADYVDEGLHRAGKFQGEARGLKGIVERAGFEGCGQDVVSSDRVVELRELTSEIAVGALSGIARTIAKTGGGGGMSVEDVETLDKSCRQEMARGVYWRWSIHNVIGRRPL